MLFLDAVLTGIGGGLLSIGLDLHATGDSGVGLAARQVSHVDEGVVESSEDVAHTEGVFSLLASSGHWGSVVSDLLFFSAFFALSALGTTLLLLSLRLYRQPERSAVRGFQAVLNAYHIYLLIEIY